MVGKRPLFSPSAADNGHHAAAALARDAPPYRDDDEEASIAPPEEPSEARTTLASQSGTSGRSSLPVRRARGFRDAAPLAVAESRRRDLKRRVLDGMNAFSLEKCRVPGEELERLGRQKGKHQKATGKKLRRFYEAQNARLDDWLEVDALVRALADDVIDSMNPDADRDGVAERPGPLHNTRGEIERFLPAEHRGKRSRDARQARWALNVNLAANVVMLAGKLVSLRFSPSLSLVASTADSALDLFCTLIIWGTNQLVAWRLDSLRKKYPVGRRRLEPLGVLVFSVIMVVSFVQILQESVTRLLPSGAHEVAPLPAVAIAAMAANAVVKGLIGLACRPIKTTQVQALVQDCKTDVYFNTASLLFPLVGVAASVWWLDPLGAALLALYVIYDWADTCLQNVTRLTGSSVDDALYQKLIYLAYRFSPVVAGYKSLTAYHAGDGVWVELDILLDEKTDLPRAHDVAETLQYCYEGLREVDRAFVSIDYSSLGPSGHAWESGTGQ